MLQQITAISPHHYTYWEKYVASHIYSNIWGRCCVLVVVVYTAYTPRAECSWCTKVCSDCRWNGRVANEVTDKLEKIKTRVLSLSWQKEAACHPSPSSLFTRTSSVDVHLLLNLVQIMHKTCTTAQFSVQHYQVNTILVPALDIFALSGTMHLLKAHTPRHITPCILVTYVHCQRDIHLWIRQWLWEHNDTIVYVSAVLFCPHHC